MMFILRYSVFRSFSIELHRENVTQLEAFQQKITKDDTIFFMNDIATELRSMSQATLDALMRISDYSGSLSELDYHKLVFPFFSKTLRNFPLLKDPRPLPSIQKKKTGFNTKERRMNNLK